MERNFWNDASLSAPPINTYKSLDHGIDMRTMKTIVKDALDVLDNQQLLHKDAAVVSRLHYKLATKFRHDIGFSHFKRTHIALLKYLNLKLTNDLNTFFDVVESIDKTYLPTRQMLEYVLVRMQVFSKLMCRIVVSSRMSATYYFDRIKRGDAWWLSFMPYTVLCRIWYLTRHLLKNSFKWYNSLVVFRDQLKVVGVPFAPNDYIFPEKIGTWINVDWLDEKTGQFWLPAVMDIEDEKSNESIVLNEKVDDLKMLQHNVQKVIESKTNNINRDIGEKVSRDAYGHSRLDNIIDPPDTNLNLQENVKNMNSNRIKITDNGKILNKITDSTESILSGKTPANSLRNKVNGKYLHSIDTVTDKLSLKLFIKVEEHYRNKTSSKAITKRIGFMQWQTLKTRLVSAASKITDKNERRVIKKMKKIFAKVC